MKSKIHITPEIAECVGLWLAEGDSKTKREITFTNNCFPLIKYFSNTILKIFKEYHLKPRIYVYTAKKEKTKVPLKNMQINYYVDKRATKPYFIFRVCSTKAVYQWHYLVKKITQQKKHYTNILRGFFAGEGNIKNIESHKQRVVRIAQKEPNNLIERILNYNDIQYRFSHHERTYVISGIWNWNKLAGIKIADLHPVKKESFWRVYHTYEEKHYPKHHIRHKILKLLIRPHTSLELAKKFNRSQYRIQDILIPLKKKGALQVFRIRSKAYWIRTDQNKILISDVKRNYLKLLKKSRRTSAELAREFDVDWKSSYRRLLELQKLHLVQQDSQSIWRHIPTRKEVIIL